MLLHSVWICKQFGYENFSMDSASPMKEGRREGSGLRRFDASRKQA